MPRRTRIVCTLGPATDKPGVLEALLEAGLDVARINYSHGTFAENAQRIARLRELTAQAPRPVAVLADLPGPKLRVLLQAPMPLAAGQEVTVALEPPAAADLRVTEPEVLAGLAPGQRVLLDDGRLILRAVERRGDRAVLRVETGGVLLPNKGLNLPDTPLGLPAVTPRDREALQAAAAAQVDWLALSFVRDPAAADAVRAAARDYGLTAPVLAKIERPEAVARAAEIIDAFDGIMVARGDLGVEIPLEQVPFVQKRLIALARAAAKPVVTATDMLDSMRGQQRPTRAEASDVANAVYDGTDAVMTSGETSVGQYPVEAVQCMARIIAEAEGHEADDAPRPVPARQGRFLDCMTHLACTLAREVEARAIVALTVTGETARLAARHRPAAALIAAAPAAVLRQLALVWGLDPVPFLTPQAQEDRLEAAVRSAYAAGKLQAGDRVIVLAGHPVEGGGHYPTVRLVRVGVDGKSCEPI